MPISCWKPSLPLFCLQGKRQTLAQTSFTMWLQTIISLLSADAPTPHGIWNTVHETSLQVVAWICGMFSCSTTLVVTVTEEKAKSCSRSRKQKFGVLSSFCLKYPSSLFCLAHQFKCQPWIPETDALLYSRVVLAQTSNIALLALYCDCLFECFPQRLWAFQSGAYICFTFLTRRGRKVWGLFGKAVKLYFKAKRKTILLVRE